MFIVHEFLSQKCSVKLDFHSHQGTGFKRVWEPKTKLLCKKKGNGKKRHAQENNFKSGVDTISRQYIRHGAKKDRYKKRINKTALRP